MDFAEKFVSLQLIYEKRSRTYMISVQKDVKLNFPHGKAIKLENAHILFVKQGQADIEIDFRPYRLQANHLVLLTPCSNLLVTGQSDDFLCSTISYSPDVEKELILQLEPTFMAFLKEYPVAEVPEAERQFPGQMVDQLKFLLEKTEGEHRMQMVKNHLQCFIYGHYDRNKENFKARKKKNVSSQEYYFLEFINLVHQHAARERELGFYAQQLCITTRYLSAIVRNQTDKTAKEIIDEHCLQEIKLRLRTTQETLQSIAIDLHFPDQSFFSRYFKKLTGITPKEFRAKA